MRVERTHERLRDFVIKCALLRVSNPCQPSGRNSRHLGGNFIVNPFVAEGILVDRLRIFAGSVPARLLSGIYLNYSYGLLAGDVQNPNLSVGASGSVIHCDGIRNVPAVRRKFDFAHRPKPIQVLTLKTRSMDSTVNCAKRENE